MQTFGTYILPAGFLVYHFDVCLGKVEMKVVCALGYFSDYWLRNVSWVNSATRSQPKKWREEEAPPTHGGPLAWDLRWAYSLKFNWGCQLPWHVMFFFQVVQQHPYMLAPGCSGWKARGIGVIYSACLLLVMWTCLILAQTFQISPVSFIGLETLGYIYILKLKLALFIMLLKEDSN